MSVSMCAPLADDALTGYPRPGGLEVIASTFFSGRGARRLLTVAALAIGALALAAPSASAGLLVQSAPSCKQKLEQPFAKFGDYAYYTLVRGGSFESGAPGWQLSRSQVVSGSNPYQVQGGGGVRSLQISGGGVATSPTVCVGLEHPTMRFFVKSSGGLLSLSTLSVEVLAETSLGLVVPVPIGVVLPNTRWSPTGRFLVVANLLPLLPDNYTPVAFRFRAIGGATWTIDDVYVDPKHR
jgi:hypothetical protein